MSDEYSESCLLFPEQGRQAVHLQFPLEQLHHRVQSYEQEFAGQEVVTMIDWGCSYKLEQGYMVLEWNEEVDLAFLQRLNADPDILDYCVYTIPNVEFEEMPVEGVRDVA